MVLNKKCELCDYPHSVIHHIIPLCFGGENCKENIIYICPNHHHEAHHNTTNREDAYLNFIEKYNLNGKMISENKKEVMKLITKSFFEKDWNLLAYYIIKTRISLTESLSYCLGITVRQLKKQYWDNEIHPIDKHLIEQVKL
jgi:hypothetical protein